jgi:hypothetical protein
MVLNVDAGQRCIRSIKKPDQVILRAIVLAALDSDQAF